MREVRTTIMKQSSLIVPSAQAILHIFSTDRVFGTHTQNETWLLAHLSQAIEFQKTSGEEVPVPGWLPGAISRALIGVC